MLNKTEKSPLTRAHAAKKCNEARHNLLLVIILSVVNIVLYLTGSEMMMLFSATIPYFSVIFGHVWSQELEAPAFFVIGLCIAFVVLALYLACWLLAKKSSGWMIAALVLFSLDTLALIGLYVSLGDISGILDVLIHGWVLYYLIMGVYYGHKLKTLPEDPVPAEEIPVDEAAPAQEAGSADSETDNV